MKTTQGSRYSVNSETHERIEGTEKQVETLHVDSIQCNSITLVDDDGEAKLMMSAHKDSAVIISLVGEYNPLVISTMKDQTHIVIEDPLGSARITIETIHGKGKIKVEDTDGTVVLESKAEK